MNMDLHPSSLCARGEMEAVCFRDTVEGVELHWSVRGAGSDVIVLHGLTDSERSWWPVMAALGRRHRVLGLDLPGCGLSARPNASYSLDWQARIVAAWLDRVGVTQCDVVGHSFGGGLALWLLLYRARALRRLALVSPGGLGRDLALELRLAALPLLVERCGQPCMRTVTRWFTRVHAHSLTPEERRQLCEMNALPGTARAFARAVRNVTTWRGQTHSFLRRVQEVECLPAMALFWGENDRVIPIRHGEALCSALENCRLERFPAAGHFLHWERPAELAAALASYFAEPSVPPARPVNACDELHATEPTRRAEGGRLLSCTADSRWRRFLPATR